MAKAKEEIEIRNVAKDGGIDLGAYVQVLEKLSGKAAETTKKLLDKQTKICSEYLQKQSKNLDDEQKSQIQSIMKSAKTFDDLKSQLESSGIKIAVDNSDFHKAFDEMKGAETAYTKQKEQIAIANAKTEKKILEQRLKTATDEERKQIREKQLATTEQYTQEKRQIMEVLQAKREVFKEEREQILNNQDLSEEERQNSLNAIEAEMDANEKAIGETSKNISDAVKLKEELTVTSASEYAEMMHQKLLNKDKNKGLTTQDKYKMLQGGQEKLDELKADKENMEKQRTNIASKYGMGTTDNPIDTSKMSPEDAAAFEELADALIENSKATKALTESNKEVAKATAGSALKDYISSKVKDKLSAANIDSVISTFYSVQGRYMARLQGAETSYNDALTMIRHNVGLNPFINQQNVVKKLQTLIDGGIAYDVELRAFLGEMSERIATTFEITNQTMNRMIRLQQADTSASRLGMEAYLTRFYNKLFSDSSYLDAQFDSVTSAIFDASANLEKAQSIEFEYAVQKWLGALYSLGLSDSTVSTIAQGLNYLGTGDVEALNSNSQLTTLFGMSASKAGIPYAEILTNGLDAETTNKLLESMVMYLKDIASQTKENNVVAKSYSNILGISTADLRVMQSLDARTINSISSNLLTYQDTLDELNYQFTKIAERTQLSTLLSTLGDNALTQTALKIGGSPILYPIWYLTNMIKGATQGAGLPIPQVLAAGFGIDVKAKIEDLILNGITGYGLFSSMLGALSHGVAPFGTVDLNKWGLKEKTSRGSAPTIKGSGIQQGISQSTDYSSTSGGGSDIENATLASAGKSASEKSSILNESGNATVEHTIDDVYESLFEDQIPISVKLAYDSEDVLSKIYGSLFEDRKAVLAEVYGSSGSGDGSDTISSQSYFSSSMGDSAVSLQTTAQAVTESTSYNASSASSLQQTLTKINQLTENGETSLSVNIKNVPNMTLSGISDDVKNEIKSYIEDKLKDLLSEAISSGMSFTDEEDSSALSIQGMLKNIMDSVGLTQSSASDISNQMDSLMFRTNM